MPADIARTLGEIPHMGPLLTTRAIGLLAAGAMLIAACGGGAATTAPSEAPLATAAPLPTEAPAATVPGFSFALPSFRGDPELVAMIPEEIGGETVKVISMTGDEFPIGGSPEIAAALDALDKTAADLSVAFAGTTQLSIVAFRVKGVPADTLFNEFKAAQTDEFTTQEVSYGGKDVVKTTSADGTVAFMYLKDDTMFVVGGSGATTPSDELLNEAFTKLP
jgi:hypothetical protein